ncbi:peroxidase family protein [Nonomuraea dietziae]|uniref:peroxidase family protein n=1 Tax=Nonomuraea dietziae TaxID=65515 RepID=UPI0031E076FF
MDVASIADSRALALAPYNSYREHCRFPRVRRFEHVSGDPRVVEGLRSLYRSVDDLDLYVGLFAEEPGLARRDAAAAADQDHRHRRLLPGADQPAAGAPDLQLRHLLAQGMRIIAATRRLADVVRRNTPRGPHTAPRRHDPAGAPVTSALHRVPRQGQGATRGRRPQARRCGRRRARPRRGGHPRAGGVGPTPPPPSPAARTLAAMPRALTVACLTHSALLRALTNPDGLGCAFLGRQDRRRRRQVRRDGGGGEPGRAHPGDLAAPEDRRRRPGPPRAGPPTPCWAG